MTPMLPSAFDERPDILRQPFTLDREPLLIGDGCRFCLAGDQEHCECPRVATRATHGETKVLGRFLGEIEPSKSAETTGK